MNIDKDRVRLNSLFVCIIGFICITYWWLSRAANIHLLTYIFDSCNSHCNCLHIKEKSALR